MERGGVSMDASQDVWDWEVLPHHMSSSMNHDNTTLVGDKKTMEHVIMPPSEDAGVHEPIVDECKDIGIVPEEAESVSSVTDLMVADGEEEEKTLLSPDAKESDDGMFAEEEKQDVTEKDDDSVRPECVVFRVGKLKVNGIGALCSFGVAAATICIFLVGGKLQHHHRQQQQQKIQLQFYGDDKRIQQVVQQTSRLNQAMSSVMGAGATTRANISFGGFYDGF